jgi:hypothetical protein
MLSAFLLTSAVSVPELSDSAPDPEITPAAPVSAQLYLPLTMYQTEMYTVSGQIMNSLSTPMAGAKIVPASGASVETGSDGRFSLEVPSGENGLAPELDGYVFAPGMADMNFGEDVENLNFTAVDSFSDAIVNGSFEYNDWWSFPSTLAPGAYTTDLAHTGLRSARAGIFEGETNLNTDSSVRSQLIYIPPTTDYATLRLWLYTVNSEPSSAPDPERTYEGGDASPTFTTDAQYVRVLNSSNQELELLLMTRSDNPMWTLHGFNMLRWAGSYIKIEIGSYNDGAGGVTALYVDDVVLEISPEIPPTPTPTTPVPTPTVSPTTPTPSETPTPTTPPTTCTNYLVNSGFEDNSGWQIPNTAYKAGYNTVYSFLGARSMRTGISLYTWDNVFSYSDTFQKFTLPDAPSSARLRLHLFQQSESPGVYGPEMAPPEPGTRFGEEPLTSDVQYIIVINAKTDKVIDHLLWQNKNNSGWVYKEFDLMPYRGKQIKLQIGTYNNGWGGRSVMYVDEAYVDVCTSGTPVPTPTVTPTPPSGCTEKIINGSFENNKAWYIPITAFSAGYSSARAYIGSRSMRSGIVYASHNRYSYSDFRQTLTIPSGISSASLNYKAYPASGESSLSPVPEIPTSPKFGTEAMSGDVQYLLILNQYGYWIDTLMWRRGNERYWANFSYNLKKYAGDTISLQWGTYNNGYGGVTSMYVDDVSLQVCP